MYECPSCGAGLFFNPKTQKLNCSYCDNEYSIDEVDDSYLKKAKTNGEVNQEKDKNVYKALVYKCTQCGAELITTDETISTFCSYCGASAVLDRSEAKKRKPDYILPFKKSKQECEKAYLNKLNKSFLVPNNMKDPQQIEKIRGIYMPYWIYNFKCKKDVEGIGKFVMHSGLAFEEYDDCKVSATCEIEANNIVRDAAKNFSDALSDEIKPFEMFQKKEFYPAYLTGFYADAEDCDSDTYKDEICKYVDERVNEKIKLNSVFRLYDAEHQEIHIEPNEVKLGLFPVYFLATKNKRGNRVSYAVINGQTGKMSAEIPIDVKKYMLLSILTAIPIFILLNLFLTVIPQIVLFIAMLFNIISYGILYNYRKRLLKKIKNQSWRNEHSNNKFRNMIVSFIFSTFCYFFTFKYNMRSYIFWIRFYSIWCFKNK